MSLRAVTMTIPGIPKPKGSLKCLGRRGRVAHQLIEDHRPGQREWRDRIADTVRTRVTTRADHGEPVAVLVSFTLPRPTSHYGTGRNAHTLKDRFRRTPASGHRTGDVDKLARLVLDALQDGGLLDDDAQVVELTASKTYLCHPECSDPKCDALPYAGARITVRPA